MKFIHKKNIAIIETNFQKNILDYIVDNFSIYYDDLLIIDLRKVDEKDRYKFVIEDKAYYINLNSPSGVFKSLKSILELNLIVLSCDNLICTYFFSFSTHYLSNFINSKFKILIDDGVGSYTFLKNNITHLNNFNSIYKSLFVRFLLILRFKFKKISWRAIDKYMSVYDFGKEYLLCHEFLPFWNSKFDEVVSNNNVFFIGSPVVEFGIINIKTHLKFLEQTSKLFGNFNYLKHPDEKLINFNFTFINTVKTDLSAEDYFIQNGVPKIIVGYDSSVLLNMSYYDNVKIFFFKVDCLLNDDVYELFVKRKIQLLHTNVL
jgi:hypothetical protein